MYYELSPGLALCSIGYISIELPVDWEELEDR
jgi:hypothetical protein